MNNDVYKSLNSAKLTLEGLKDAYEKVVYARNSADAQKALTELMTKLGDFASNELSGTYMAVGEALIGLDRLDAQIRLLEMPR
jgi:hypothetical protein